ncbi:hypothetical protein KIPB_002444, partial [Kipferlia bialata]|eukprot:g2444.t1
MDYQVAKKYLTPLLHIVSGTTKEGTPSSAYNDVMEEAIKVLGSVGMRYPPLGESLCPLILHIARRQKGIPSHTPRVPRVPGAVVNDKSKGSISYPPNCVGVMGACVCALGMLCAGSPGLYPTCSPGLYPTCECLMESCISNTHPYLRGCGLEAK